MWTGNRRYTNPRLAGCLYTSVRPELLGGLETGVEFGLGTVVLLGAVGYITGSAIS